MVLAAGRDCVLGTDQSRYQPANNVDAHAAARRFVVNKVSGGDGGLYADATWAQKNASHRGKAWRGGYHFLGNENSGEAQADFFVRSSGGYVDVELPPTVDFETYGSAGQFRPSSDKLRGFITEIHRLIPRRWTGPQGHPVAIIVYTGKPLEPGLFPGIEIYDLWLAAYLNGRYPNPWDGVTNGHTPNVSALGSPDRFIPRPWRTWGGWQFAGGDGGAPGVGNTRSGCDQDVMTTEMFVRLTGGFTETKDWFEMASKQDLKDALKELIMDDAEVGAQIAYWVLRARAEGQPKAIEKGLPNLEAFVNGVTHELLENGPAAPAPDEPTLRDLKDRQINAGAFPR